MDYNTELARSLLRLKRDLGVLQVRQGYRGTGSRAHRRQIWVALTPDRSIDLWLESDRVELGGVCMTRYGSIPHAGRPVAEVYQAIVEALAPLVAPRPTP